MQQERVIAYVSRQLKSHEVKYPVYDLELAVRMFTLRVWRHYCIDPNFRFSLIIKVWGILCHKKKLNVQKRIWVELIKDYNCVIDYHSRRLNVIVDAPSCKNKVVLDEPVD
jgi:hypothetical protein